MESIIEKLDKIGEPTKGLDTWSLEEKKQLLELYYIISKNESKIFDLIYLYHECDSWEDIFRDYDFFLLHEKKRGVKIAIDVITKRMNENLNEDKDEDENENEKST